MRRLARVVPGLIFAGCGASSPPPPAAPAPASALAAVTYAGDIPCADCPGQRLVVTLFPDGTFRLRRTYLGVVAEDDRSTYELGRYARALDDGRRLVLRGGNEGPREFELIPPARLRMLDRAGRPIESTLPYELSRQTQVDPIEGPMRLRGMYAYMADAASIDECLTGRRYPVTLEGDHLAVERAYLALQREPGQRVLVSFEGRFELREPEPGLPPRDHVVVERFERFWPTEKCAAVTAELLGTYWRAVEIDGEPVVVTPGGREPHFVLSPEMRRVSGFSGCNRLVGSFDDGASGFRFRALAGTRMACPGPGDALERRFLGALEATVKRRLTADSLELLDAQGAVRMRLEATPLR
jgi:heat shock protein HslJ